MIRSGLRRRMGLVTALLGASVMAVGLMAAPGASAVTGSVGIRPSSVTAYTGVPVSFTLAPSGVAATSRPIHLQVRQGTSWTTVATGTWRGSAVVLRHAPTVAGQVYYRGLLPAYGGRAAVGATGVGVPLSVTATRNTVSVTGPVSAEWITGAKLTVKVTATPALAASQPRTVTVQTRPSGQLVWRTAATGTVVGSKVFTLPLSRGGRIQTRVLLAAAPGLPAATSGTTSFLSVVTPVPPVAAASTPITPEVVGVNLSNMAQRVRPAGAPATYAAIRLWDSGTSWRDIEKSPGVYDWARMDALVADAVTKKQKIMYVAGSTPAFHATSTTSTISELYGPGSTMPPKSLLAPYTDPQTSTNAYAKFLYALAMRYAGKIESYQAGNEINLTVFWQGTPGEAAEMTAITRNVINLVNSKTSTSAKVVSSSVATRKVKYFYDFTVAHYAELAKRGWPVDAYTAHFYTLYAATIIDYNNLLGMFQRVLAEAGAPKKPIWNTEVNFRANPGPTDTILPPLTESEQRAIVGQLYIRGLSAGVSRTYFYGWMPDAVNGNLGIELYTNTPADKALMQMRTWVDSATSMAGCTTTAATGLTSCKLQTVNGVRYIAWSETGTSALSALGTVQSVQTLQSGDPVRGILTVSKEPVLVAVG